MKAPKGIIIGGWRPEEYPLAAGQDHMIQVYVRAIEDGPPKDGESHWIRAEDHRRLMREARSHYLENIMISIRNQIASSLLMEQVKLNDIPDYITTTDDGACL